MSFMDYAGTPNAFTRLKCMLLLIFYCGFERLNMVLKQVLNRGRDPL